MKKLFAIILITVFFSCGKQKEKIYVYEVTGSASDFSVTYTNKDGGTDQIASVKSGWRYKFEDSDSKRFVYVSAQNNTSMGDVNVKIYYKEELIEQGHSDGAYTIATASR